MVRRHAQNQNSCIKYMQCTEWPNCTKKRSGKSPVGSIHCCNSATKNGQNTQKEIGPITRDEHMLLQLLDQAWSEYTKKESGQSPMRSICNSSHFKVRPSSTNPSRSSTLCDPKRDKHTSCEDTISAPKARQKHTECALNATSIQSETNTPNATSKRSQTTLSLSLSLFYIYIYI